MTDDNEVLGASGFLFTEVAGPREKQTILIVLIISLAGFVVGLPFVRVQLPEMAALVPAFAAAVWIIDVVIAVLLFGQFMELRSRSLLILAAGYVFLAAMVVPHALTFPGAFTPSGLLGAGPQTAVWLNVFWRSGFPLFVLAYSLAARQANDRVASDPRRAVFVACAGPIVLAAGFVILTTLGHEWLPAVIENAPDLIGVGSTIWVAALVALVVLWARRKPTVLDLWLMAVLVAWLLETTYSDCLGRRTYDFGWYAGHIYGLLARSFVLVMLLVQTSRLSASLAQALNLAERHNADLLRTREDAACAQPAEAIWKVVAGVAHDFKNILTVILGSLEVVRREENQSPKHQKLIQSALAAAGRGADATRELLTFVRSQALRPEAVDANAVIRENEGFIKQAVGEAVGVTLNLSPVLWPVQFDRAQFETALLNLVVNARDAVDGAGEIIIETRNVVMVEGDIPNVPGGDYVVISVTDNGPGIPQEVAARAFDPFYTTKEVGKGSGLGLAQVYGFARGAGGSARVGLTWGAGARIELYVPRRQERPIDGVALCDLSGDNAAPRQAKVLLVDDDDDVRASIADLLIILGFDVVTAAGAREALSILSRDTAITVLFSDIAMPGGMDGAQLAVEARRIYPDLKILLASGFPAPMLARKYALPENIKVLCKPFMPDDLLEEFRRLTRAASRPVDPPAAPRRQPGSARPFGLRRA